MTETPAADTMSGYSVTVTLTLRMIGRYRSPESAEEFTRGLMTSGQIRPGDWETAITVAPLCVRCNNPIPGTPVTDPDDPLGRKYCRDECRDADAEGAYEQHYPSGVAT